MIHLYHYAKHISGITGNAFDRIKINTVERKLLALLLFHIPEKYFYSLLIIPGVQELPIDITFNEIKVGVQYGSRDWRPSTLLRLRFITHCTAQFYKPANEQVVLLLKAYKYSPEQKSGFDYNKQRRFYLTDKQCHAVLNKLVYSADIQFLNQNISALINYCCQSYRLSSIYQKSSMYFLTFLKKLNRVSITNYTIVTLRKL